MEKHSDTNNEYVENAEDICKDIILYDILNGIRQHEYHKNIKTALNRKITSHCHQVDINDQEYIKYQSKIMKDMNNLLFPFINDNDKYIKLILMIYDIFLGHEGNNIKLNISDVHNQWNKFILYITSMYNQYLHNKKNNIPANTDMVSLYENMIHNMYYITIHKITKFNILPNMCAILLLIDDLKRTLPYFLPNITTMRNDIFLLILPVIIEKYFLCNGLQLMTHKIEDAMSVLMNIIDTYMSLHLKNIDIKVLEQDLVNENLTKEIEEDIRKNIRMINLANYISTININEIIENILSFNGTVFTLTPHHQEKIQEYLRSKKEKILPLSNYKYRYNKNNTIKLIDRTLSAEKYPHFLKEEKNIAKYQEI